MSEPDLEARIDAVERAVTDGDADLDGIRESAALSGDVDDLDARVSDLEERLADLEAAVQAVRGYAGNVRAVNRDVERRANAALAAVERLERSITDPERIGDSDDRPGAPSDRSGTASGPPDGSLSETPREQPAGRGTSDAESGTAAQGGPGGITEPDRGLELESERARDGDQSRDEPARKPRAPGDQPSGHASARGGESSSIGDADRSLGGERGETGGHRRNGPAGRAAATTGNGDGRRDGDGGTSKRTERFIERVRDAL